MPAFAMALRTPLEKRWAKQTNKQKIATSVSFWLEFEKGKPKENWQK